MLRRLRPLVPSRRELSEESFESSELNASSASDALTSLSGALNSILARTAEQAAELAAKKILALDGPPKRLYGVRDAARALDTSHTVLYRCIRSGMPVVRIGASTKVDLEQAIAWLREHGSSVTR